MSNTSKALCKFLIDKHWASKVVQVVKNLPANAGDKSDVDLIPELGRSPGGEHDNPLQYSCLKNPHGQRSLVGYSPQGCKESDTTKATQHSTNTR